MQTAESRVFESLTFKLASYGIPHVSSPLPHYFVEAVDVQVDRLHSASCLTVCSKTVISLFDKSDSGI